jgi:uncharacterized membrane protein
MTQAAKATKTARVGATPRDWLRLSSALLAALGALDAAYLTYIKLAHVEAICRGVGDCESVNSSIYSEIHGIPIAVFGLLAYLAILALLGLETRLALLQDYGPLSIFGLALTGTLYSAYLTYVELFVIHAVCPYCVASALLITGLLVLAVIRLVRGPLGGLSEQ